MIVILGLILGAATGATLARYRGGSRADMLQYAAAYAVAFSLVGLVLTIVIHRLAV